MAQAALVEGRWLNSLPLSFLGGYTLQYWVILWRLHKERSSPLHRVALLHPCSTVVEWPPRSIAYLLLSPYGRSVMVARRSISKFTSTNFFFAACKGTKEQMFAVSYFWWYNKMCPFSENCIRSYYIVWQETKPMGGWCYTYDLLLLLQCTMHTFYWDVIVWP